LKLDVNLFFNINIKSNSTGYQVFKVAVSVSRSAELVGVGARVARSRTHWRTNNNIPATNANFDTESSGLQLALACSSLFVTGGEWHQIPHVRID
jgi:hypothetical protein